MHVHNAKESPGQGKPVYRFWCLVLYGIADQPTAACQVSPQQTGRIRLSEKS